MKRKSKFMTFLLSFIPGLSHFYLGYPDRGLIYLIIFGALCVGTVGLAIISGMEELLVFLLGVPIIWLIALMDSFSIINSIKNGENAANMQNNLGPEETRASNKKIISLALSIIPGAGHMYLGYQQKGLVLMGGFFFTVFFMGWLNLSMFLFILPLIWFYSFFDAFHTLNGNDVEDVDILKILPSIKPEYAGYGLIGVGVVIILQKILYPLVSTYMDWQFINKLQTSIVALIFIIIGIKMLGKKKVEEVEEEVEDEE